MGRLIYSAIASLDGYIEDSEGGFDWAAPDEEVHAFVNDLERSVGTYLYGRRMYETMLPWEKAPSGPDQTSVARDFSDIWQRADKVVYSRTLDSVSSDRTRVERAFEPTAVQHLKATLDRDLTIGGATLAAEALSEGLVDELELLVVPVLVGGGKRSLPAGLRMSLDLVETRRFASGVVFVRYKINP